MEDLKKLILQSRWKGTGNSWKEFDLIALISCLQQDALTETKDNINIINLEGTNKYRQEVVLSSKGEHIYITEQLFF